jgi:hypothetical protein
MRRLLQTLAVTLVAAALCYAGFYLTGAVVVHIDHRALGLSAQTAFAPLMFLAWGMPAASVGLLAGLLLQRRSVWYAWFCALAETVMLVGVQGGIFPLSSTLLWPVIFIVGLLPLGALFGSKLRAAMALTPNKSIHQ